MDYKYNILTNEYPEIYMPGYGEPFTKPMPQNTNTSPLPTNLSTDPNAYILFLYPKEAREINKLVNNKLDTLDYEGSIIFHEYPDKEALMNIIDQINIPFSVEEISPNWLRQLIEVIFIYEMNNKRMLRNNANNNSNDNNENANNNSSPTSDNMITP